MSFVTIQSIHLVGPNGCGKTTLAGEILQGIRDSQPDLVVKTFTEFVEADLKQLSGKPTMILCDDYIETKHWRHCCVSISTHPPVCSAS